MTNDGTLKVTPIESARPQVAAKFTITASLDGFPVQVEVEGKAGDLRALVDRLKAIGATPPAQALPDPTKASGTPDSAPTCQYHGPMKRSKFGSGWICTKRMGNGEYCDQKAE